jgi:hypothetical protein
MENVLQQLSTAKKHSPHLTTLISTPERHCFRSFNIQEHDTTWKIKIKSVLSHITSRMVSFKKKNLNLHSKPIYISCKLQNIHNFSCNTRPRKYLLVSFLLYLFECCLLSLQNSIMSSINVIKRLHFGWFNFNEKSHIHLSAFPMFLQPSALRTRGRQRPRHCQTRFQISPGIKQSFLSLSGLIRIWQ